MSNLNLTHGNGTDDTNRVAAPSMSRTGLAGENHLNCTAMTNHGEEKASFWVSAPTPVLEVSAPLESAERGSCTYFAQVAPIVAHIAAPIVAPIFAHIAAKKAIKKQGFKPTSLLPSCTYFCTYRCTHRQLDGVLYISPFRGYIHPLLPTAWGG